MVNNDALLSLQSDEYSEHQFLGDAIYTSIWYLYNLLSELHWNESYGLGAAWSCARTTGRSRVLVDGWLTAPINVCTYANNFVLLATIPREGPDTGKLTREALPSADQPQAVSTRKTKKVLSEGNCGGGVLLLFL